MSIIWPIASKDSTDWHCINVTGQLWEHGNIPNTRPQHSASLSKFNNSYEGLGRDSDQSQEDHQRQPREIFNRIKYHQSSQNNEIQEDYLAPFPPSEHDQADSLDFLSHPIEELLDEGWSVDEEQRYTGVFFTPRDLPDGQASVLVGGALRTEFIEFNHSAENVLLNVVNPHSPRKLLRKLF